MKNFKSKEILFEKDDLNKKVIVNLDFDPDYVIDLFHFLSEAEKKFPTLEFTKKWDFEKRKYFFFYK